MKSHDWKRCDWGNLLKDPVIKRKIICEGTVACMAREGIDIPIEQVYDMYDNFTAKGIPMPDGYTYEN